MMASRHWRRRPLAHAVDPLTLIDVDDQDSGRTGTLVSGPTES